MDEQLAIIRRIFRAALYKKGSAARLAHHLGLSFPQLGTYLRGEAMPSELVLLHAVELVLDDLPHIRAEFSSEVWNSLALPR